LNPNESKNSPQHRLTRRMIVVSRQQSTCENGRF